MNEQTPHRHQLPITSRMAVRLAGTVFLCALVVLVVLLGYNYHVTRTILVHEAEQHAQSIGLGTGEAIARVLAPVENVAQAVADAMAQKGMNPLARQQIVRQTLKNNPAIYGMAVAYAPYGAYPKRRAHAPYQFREGGSISFANLGSRQNDYFSMEWYTTPRDTGAPNWSEPYFDEGGGGVLVITYSVPWFKYADGKRQFAGVVTADVALDWLKELITSIKLYDTGYAAVVSKKGTYVYHPIESLVMQGDVFTLARERNDPELAEIGKRMVGGESGFVWRKSVKGDVASFLYYAPLPIGGWSLALLFPENEVLASEHEMVRNMVGIGLAGIAFLALMVFWISFRIARPVHALSDAALDMAEGDLDVALPALGRSDEIGSFARTFDTMRTSLKEHIRTLAETTAAKERIESELRIARDIQMSILPKAFPPYPGVPEVEVLASVEPAKEVGGDLYDFFFVDDHRFYFLVGDVSDKGVPAALFMAVTKTLLGIVAEQGHPPGVVLAKVNDDLAEGNDSCMFVTLFLACLDIRTGELEYACAGHDPAFVLRRDGGMARLPGVREPIAGAMGEIEYTTLHAKLEPGDALVAYTDGVTEAMNHAQELFGEERLMQALGAVEELEAHAIMETVRARVGAFVRDAPQSDDITLLALKFVGPDGEKS